MEYGIEMDYAIGDLPKMDTEAETHIFRIMQEIVFNTVKHSGASKLRVKMETGKDGKVRIQTADNGCVQMDPKKAAGHGLENIKSRAVFLGGEAYMNYVKGFKWHILIKSDTNKINENVPGE